MSPTTKKDGFTAEEKAAMRARAKELKATEDGETAVQEALAKMTPKAVLKRYVPPGRTSISSTTVPSPHHSGISSGSVHTE